MFKDKSLGVARLVEILQALYEYYVHFSNWRPRFAVTFNPVLIFYTSDLFVYFIDWDAQLSR